MRNITIKARIILLISVSVLFSALIGGAFLYQMLQLKDFSIAQTQEAMLVGQKERLKLSVHAMALSLGESLKDAEGDPWLEAASKYVAGTQVTGTVQDVNEMARSLNQMAEDLTKNQS